MTNADIAARQDMWNQILERIGAAGGAITDQANRAAEQFPELVGAFNLLVAYTGHLHEAIERSPAADLHPYALTKHFCSHNTQICRCAHGHFDDCKLLGAELVPIEPEPLTCDELWEQYLAALAKERAELIQALQAVRTSGKPLVVADATRLQTLTAAQQATQLLREALWNRKCALPGAMD
jgi:hypothetical protein